MTDLVLPPGRGMPDGLVIPDAELVERFSRSSGPGGQGVNTTDSRVELRWDIAASRALTEVQRAQLLRRLDKRLTDGTLTITASEQRAQVQNRGAARARLVALVTQALEPPAPPRRATRPSRAARQRSRKLPVPPRQRPLPIRRPRQRPRRLRRRILGRHRLLPRRRCRDRAPARCPAFRSSVSPATISAPAGRATRWRRRPTWRCNLTAAATLAERSVSTWPVRAVSR